MAKWTSTAKLVLQITYASVACWTPLQRQINTNALNKVYRGQDLLWYTDEPKTTNGTGTVFWSERPTQEIALKLGSSTHFKQKCMTGSVQITLKD